MLNFSPCLATVKTWLLVSYASFHSRIHYLHHFYVKHVLTQSSFLFSSVINRWKFAESIHSSFPVLSSTMSSLHTQLLESLLILMLLVSSLYHSSRYAFCFVFPIFFIFRKVHLLLLLYKASGCSLWSVLWRCWNTIRRFCTESDLRVAGSVVSKLFRTSAHLVKQISVTAHMGS